MHINKSAFDGMDKQMDRVKPIYPLDFVCKGGGYNGFYAVLITFNTEQNSEAILIPMKNSIS